MALVFENDDLNGECFIAGSEGERQVQEPHLTYVLPEGFPVAAIPMERVTPTNVQVLAFIRANYAALDGNNRTDADKAKIAYARMLCVRLGYVSPSFQLNAFHVKYSNVITLDTDETAAIVNTHDGVIAGILTNDVKKSIRLTLLDMICCVAYMFRVRGHHYKNDFVARYDSLWLRCLKTPDERPLSWELFATCGIHAIFPLILDNIWRDAVDNNKCAGTLVKRFESAPAGVAGVFALKRGIDDVTLLFPGVRAILARNYDTFMAIHTQLSATRWAGSVNCSMYGEQRIRVNEGEIGVLASAVIGIYGVLAPDSKLVESPALMRLAEIAPATGGLLGSAATNAGKDERLNLLNYEIAPAAVNP